VPHALVLQALEVKNDIENAGQRVKEEANGKFADMTVAKYGSVSDFHKGLSTIGVPHPNILEHMRTEHLNSADSSTFFKAWNSGRIDTTPEVEWDFVVAPFEPESVCADKRPVEWALKHQYGGKRSPIRLEVFMHVFSALQAASNTWFGNYKNAHQLDDKDPQWLHEDEVDFVDVVLMRFIKSQLDHISLANALTTANIPMDAKHAKGKAERIIKALDKALHETDGPSSKCTKVLLVKALDNIATVAEIEALLDHFYRKLAVQKMTEPEVIAVRSYTGPLYVKQNGSLRFASGAFPEAMTEHLQGNKYINTIYANSSGMRKMSHANCIPRNRRVYRGMGGVKLPDTFVVAREGGGRGGTEYGFMSTTTSKQVAVQYIGEKNLPVLFEFDVGDIDRGTSLSLISQFPGEDEILVPPFSYVEVTGDSFVMKTKKGKVTVYPARINCNLKSQTIEEIQSRRQTDLVAMAPYLELERKRDHAPVLVALDEMLAVKSGIYINTHTLSLSLHCNSLDSCVILI